MKRSNCNTIRAEKERKRSQAIPKAVCAALYKRSSNTQRVYLKPKKRKMKMGGTE